MKSLKNILVVLLVAAVAFTFVSCSDASSAKVGEYYTYEISGTASGQTISYEFGANGSCTKVTVGTTSYTSGTWFNYYTTGMSAILYSFKLGTGKKLEAWSLGDESLLVDGVKYTWEEKDGKLTFKGAGEQLAQWDVDGDGYKLTGSASGTSYTWKLKKK